MDIHGATFFMHDDAPVHTCKKVKQGLTENKIECLDWPPQSPDLNPIENIWHRIKRELENYDTSSLKKLEDALKEVWCQVLKLDDFIKYADSMPKRIKECLAARGGSTSY